MSAEIKSSFYLVGEASFLFLSLKLVTRDIKIYISWSVLGPSYDKPNLWLFDLLFVISESESFNVGLLLTMGCWPRITLTFFLVAIL